MNKYTSEILEMKLIPHYPEDIGKQIDDLKILYEIENDKEYPIYYLCECKCSKKVIRERRSVLYNNGFRSCGCYRYRNNKFGLNRKHGGAKRKNGKQYRLYKTWVSMRQRCNNPKDSTYKYYGGKNIKICEEWDDYKKFYKWAKHNGYKKDLTIERIDYDKGYYPDNCKWIPKKDQAKNTSRNSYFIIDGKRIILEDLSKKLNLNRKIIKRMAIDGRLKYDYWNRDPIHNI